jgi:hypothetical protein
MHFRRVGVVGSMVATWVVPALAADGMPNRPPPYDFQAPPAYSFPARRSEWAAQVRLEGVGLGNDAASNATMGGFGVSLRPRPTRHFALDFGLDFFGGRDFHGEERGEVAFTVNPMFFLNPGSNVQLYLLTGLGFSGAQVKHQDGTRSHYRYVGFDGGAGVEFRLGRRWAFDIDMLGFIRGRTDRTADRSPEFVDPSTGRTTNTSAGAIARLGLAYYW